MDRVGSTLCKQLRLSRLGANQRHLHEVSDATPPNCAFPHSRRLLSTYHYCASVCRKLIAQMKFGTGARRPRNAAAFVVRLSQPIVIVSIGAGVLIRTIALDTAPAGLHAGWRAGAAAAVLGALSPWQIAFSRFGQEAITGSAVVTLAMVCFFGWLGRRKALYLI